MVWADSSQFPFEVYDNSGNLVAVLDLNGLTIYDLTGVGRSIRVSPSGSPDGTSMLQFDDGLGDVATIYYAHPPSTPYDYGLLVDDNREWTALPLAANFTAVNAVEYRADMLGNVMLRGLVRYTPAATIPLGTVIGTLPLYYRPPQQLVMIGCYDVVSASHRLVINTDGTIQTYDGGGGNRFPYLDGHMFSVLI